MSGRVYLVHLNWPERCFRAGAGEIALLKSLVGPGSEVVRVRSEKAFLGELPRATHAIVWRFDREWFSAARRLKVLATPGAGRELVAWRDAPAGVKVHFGRFHGAIMSETVAGFILAWSHGFFRPELRGGAWRSSWPRSLIGDKCHLVAGTHAVIAGYGSIGRAIGGRLESLGVRVSGFGRSNIGGLESAARTADWFIMALPGDTGTDGFLSRRLISMLPRRCVVVNVGRGNAVDEAALLAALSSGRLAGAYLDVFRGEPGCLSGAAAGGGRDILGTPRSRLPANLVMTPHSSAFASQYLPLCFKELKDDGII